MHDAHENPYRSPAVDAAAQQYVNLTLRQSCWKYGKLGASTALVVMGVITLGMTTLVVIGALVIGPHVWRDAPILIGGLFGLTLLMSCSCGIAGAAIGALLFAAARLTRKRQVLRK